MASPSDPAQSPTEVDQLELPNTPSDTPAYQRSTPLDGDMADLEHTINRLQSEFSERRSDDRPLAGSVAHAYQVTIDKYYARLERCKRLSAQDRADKTF